MKVRKPGIDRRDFIESVAAIGAAAITGACAGTPSRGTQSVPTVRSGATTPQALDGPLLKAGLIGCGGRGRGAAVNFLSAGPNLQIAALADVFPDRIAEARRLLKEKKGQDIPDSHCFVGFDAYQKLLDSGIDVVLHATPPHFRPAHFAAAVEAKKHVFIEKPVAVDVPGALAVQQTGERAASLGLSVLTGTQLRRELVRMEVRRRVLGGAIGDVQSLRAFRNQGALWYRTMQPGQSDMEYMIRDWVNWTWLSGDIIVEQHIHHLDAILWILGQAPQKAVGMGARLRRPTGDQYDFFSIDYAFPGDLHLHTTIRQLNGCSNVREEIVAGSKGVANLDGTIHDRSGKLIWKYDGPMNDALVQEHADWITAIRTGKPMNTVKDTTTATLMAIMGRDSAYTGKEIAWEGLLASTARLGPQQYAMGPVTIKAVPPVPGVEPGPPAP